jgi:hypothetical protein
VSKSENLPGGLSRRPRRSAPVRVKIKDIQGNVVSFASPGPAHKVWRKQLKDALGTVSLTLIGMDPGVLTGMDPRHGGLSRAV